PEGQAALGNSREFCEWHFNPSSAFHFGGLWKAAVRLIRVIGTHVFTYEEFTTILGRVEAVLN
ncbi:Integrase catalytic domain-containing protein, partial [Aphis craccivora]